MDIGSLDDSFGYNPFKWGPTPFRFENMWLQHPSFKECFSTWWRSFQGNGWEGHKFMRKLQFVKAKLKDRDKAPRPDGFTIVVFQDRWDVIKEDLVRVFAEFHRKSSSRLAELLNCKASDWRILYTGLPSVRESKACGFWDPVIERISRRLDG
ncbi:hypothetical protein CK203_019696 [Vitis vinifera]|uniref:Uncharacterized protein n=1 Tax=Vitis vinifera TaxID=29760 RepID=A0A438JQX8_VITVI|nr:hypothetical protein CK203_019696 [Vitis vinifera]